MRNFRRTAIRELLVHGPRHRCPRGTGRAAARTAGQDLYLPGLRITRGAALFVVAARVDMISPLFFVCATTPTARKLKCPRTTSK